MTFERIPAADQRVSARAAGAADLRVADLARWAASARGQALLAAERAIVSQQLPSLFGRTIVQIGSWDAVDDALLAEAQMPVRVCLGTADEPRPGEHARCDSASLPLAKGQADAVVLPHALEYAPHPHRLLRNAEQALSPRGQVVVLGFNPMSVLGLRRSLRIAPRALPPPLRLLSPNRLRDWLGVLDFETTALVRFGVGLPWLPATRASDPMDLRRCVGWLHGCYLLAARKRRTPMTPTLGRSRADSRMGQAAGAAAVRISFAEARAQRQLTRDQ